MGQAVGIIETLGLAAAIEAADTAVKSANVSLIGYENTKGGGWITIKLCGDVGAVNAAVMAGAAAARTVNKVVGTLILARPHENLELLIRSVNNVPSEPEAPEPEPEPPAPHPEPPAPQPEPPAPQPNSHPSVNDNAPAVVDMASDIFGELRPSEEGPGKVTCNLCSDPACPRQKGEARTACIHISEVTR